MQPRVTFIVPCYNYAGYVSQAIESLLSQSFQEIEVIAINDASPDNTAEVLAQFADDERVVIVTHTKNFGNIRTYNEGIAHARGEFVGVMSADDYCLDTEAVARQVAVFDTDPEIGFVYSA